MTNSKLFLIFGLLMLLLAGSITLSMHLYKQKQDAINMFESSQDDLKSHRDALDREVSKISILESAHSRDLLKLATKDSTIVELQSLVRKHRSQLAKAGSSATVIKTITEVDTLVVKDTVNTDGFFFKDEWLTLSIKDQGVTHTKLHLELKNDFYVLMGYEKKSMFKSVPYVEITNLNPYTKTTALRTYRVSVPRQKRFGVGIYVGAGINHKGQIMPSIGVGVSYNLFTF